MALTLTGMIVSNSLNSSLRLLSHSYVDLFKILNVLILKNEFFKLMKNYFLNHMYRFKNFG